MCSDESTSSLSLPALVGPPLPVGGADQNQICIPETPGSPSLVPPLAIPDSAFGRSDAAGRGTGPSTAPRNSNFEGFCDDNDDIGEITLSSETSDDEILTPAQRSNSHKNRRNFLELTKERESLAPSYNSTGSERVIIIEPVADAHPVEKFFSNDLALSRALADSPFGRAGIAKFSKNLGRKILVIALKDEPEVGMSALLSVTQLGSWTIKCRVPVNHCKSVGVIGPMGEDVTNNELAEALDLAGYSGVSAERIQKGKEKINTSMFKVTFNSNTLPTFIQLGYQRFHVNPYIAKPWQCFKCQRFGHSAISCRSAPRCVKCGGAHSIKDCTKQGDPHCCNCGGKHTASYGGCKVAKEAQIVEKIRAQQGISYKDALMAVQRSENNHDSNETFPKIPNRYMPLSGQPSAAINKPRTWAQTVKSQHNHSVQTVSTGTQTQDDHVPSTLQGITVNKFIELMCKIISLCKHSESLDITKTVTDLTKETLQSYSPAITCTNVPVSTGIVSQSKLSTGEIQGSSGDHTEVALLGAVDAEMFEDFIGPSPIIGKRPSKATQGPSKPGGKQGQSRGIIKSKDRNENSLKNKDKTNSFKKCPPPRN